MIFKNIGVKMNLIKAEIKNFRKLKNCSLSFSSDQTILVGANNSGKTSAMKVLKLFLKHESSNEGFKYTDFTFDNWGQLNKRAQIWLNETDIMNTEEELQEWKNLCPTLDLIISVESSEIHHVIEFLPSLDWDGGLIGLRLRLEPKNIEELRNDFVELCNENKRVLLENKPIELRNLWPHENIQEFLSRHLDKYFKIKSYVIDPYVDNSEELALETSEPLKGLIKIDVIGEDAGFFNTNGAKNLLSTIIQSFYKSHFDNDDRRKTANDLLAIRAVNDSKSAFDTTLTETFSEILSEIRDLGYPGSKNDPNISISSKIDQIETLGHESAIRFKINNDDGEEEIKIPEGLNGLGFRRLISITLTLIDFRESWLRSNRLDQEPIEPLHLVLIEEPEAHLHAQVQQVFIKKAYETLCHGQPSHCRTQLLVSTHSSYLARELDFSNLRYFKRKNSDLIPYAEVVDLSKTFDKDALQNEKFVTRYIKTTHCDLFFANGIILVEGDAERLLVPHFIKNHFPKLNSSYISILSVGGAHAHRLQSLIEKIDLPCLIITDLDSVIKTTQMDEKGNIKMNKDGTEKVKYEKCIPLLNASQLTNNDTLIKWFPMKDEIDDLLKLGYKDKANGNIRVSYQNQVSFDFKGEQKIAFPYTFEESTYFENRSLINNVFKKDIDKDDKRVKATGVLLKMMKAEECEDVDHFRLSIFSALDSNKVDMAMDLIYGLEPKELKTPQYIEEGLSWLENKIIGVDELLKGEVNEAC